MACLLKQPWLILPVDAMSLTSFSNWETANKAMRDYSLIEQPFAATAALGKLTLQVELFWYAVIYGTI